MNKQEKEVSSKYAKKKSKIHRKAAKKYVQRHLEISRDSFKIYACNNHQVKQAATAKYTEKILVGWASKHLFMCDEIVDLWHKDRGVTVSCMASARSRISSPGSPIIPQPEGKNQKCYIY
ncbi:hypothetical protein AVEN_58575-1 [Araneus ventricosus]|uniref:Uncharacterized protein n=1 Tax=Araneus ventricosus TaxID=182803 RepID=A0A4Y2GVV6_ARAVE|nr:hypothetical protein AVEN_58575-1 [Araneus ventricosus]